jgi:hypothetical protein
VKVGVVYYTNIRVSFILALVLQKRRTDLRHDAPLVIRLFAWRFGRQQEVLGQADQASVVE